MPSYDAEANRDLILDIILGDLDPGDLSGVTVEALNQYNTFNEEMVLGISVTVAQRNFTLREVMDTKGLEDLEQIVWKTYHGIARKMSFKLFEYDPRIGIPLQNTFPDCPLWDPPHVVLPYKTYLNETNENRIKTPREVREVFLTLTTCPFCERRIHPFGGSRQEGVWCGGNVGFAHEECAPWVTPRY